MATEKGKFSLMMNSSVNAKIAVGIEKMGLGFEK
jgi:hypothetical protein